ncbi:MAG: MoxR family ATPase, partial [Bacteroidia bacterium]|nr:MoxR family ATPase [Bacteroidia bacterium]
MPKGDYVASPELIEALNVALEMGMPLLLTGEPGSGKTRFAWHLVEHFENLGEAPLVFNAKTTSNATDLFYQYDALGHYRLSHYADKPTNLDLISNKIIQFKALGEAIQIAQTEKRRSVVLIDEIDKAPRDFPNDLLYELDREFSFEVSEMSNEPFSADNSLKPIIIITSNSEKTLPAPFLRRCVYFHIEFPAADALYKIVSKQLAEIGMPSMAEDQLRSAISEFEFIRTIAEGLNVKKPATAELIIWIILLQKMDLMEHVGKTKVKIEIKDKLRSSYTVLCKNG